MSDFLEQARQRAAANGPLPQLRVGDEVGDIPLRPLLQDFADTNPRGARLVVSHDDDVPEAIGYAVVSYSEGPNRYNIKLNVTKLRESGTFDLTLGHEVAHLLDPSGFNCGGEHEDFANALAPRLLEFEPATVADAQHLIEDVKRLLGEGNSGTSS